MQRGQGSILGQGVNYSMFINILTLYLMLFTPTKKEALGSS
jgi:hypothetical protein